MRVFKGRPGRKSSAAIKLHHGDGSIIRNNDIVIDQGLLNTAPKVPAIALVEGRDVLVENNRIYGTEELTRLRDEKSNAIPKNNEIRSLLFRPR